MLRRLILSLAAIGSVSGPVPVWAATSHEGPMTCSVPILDPSAVQTERGVMHSDSEQKRPPNAQSDVDIAGDFHNDYGVSAEFTLPYVPGNSGLFYSNWVILKALKGSPSFVQIELMRWKKYDYRDEIGLTWMLSDGVLIFRDSGIMLPDGPHRLGISQANGLITLSVDRQAVCTTPFSAFFTSDERMYYQLGTEVSGVGDHPAGTLDAIEIKNDEDADYNAAHPSCVYRGFGVSWEYDGDGRFHAAGTFDPHQPYLLFTGLQRDQKCVF